MFRYNKCQKKISHGIGILPLLYEIEVVVYEMLF